MVAALPGAPLHDAKVLPRLFRLRRIEDVHDFTGPGIVAWGVEWPDGTATYRWNSAMATTVIARTVEDVRKIHGHDGRTVLEFAHLQLHDCDHIGCGYMGIRCQGAWVQ